MEGSGHMTFVEEPDLFIAIVRSFLERTIGASSWASSMRRRLAAGRRSRVRILVVEDSEKMLHLIRRGLEEEGFAVDVARDGDEASGSRRNTRTRRSSSTSRSAVRAIDGFEVCRRLRDAGAGHPC